MTTTTKTTTTSTTTTTKTTTQTVNVPNVVGQSLDSAKSMLQSQGFEVTVAFVASSKPKNTVIAQDPSAGSMVPRNTMVRITVSKGVAVSAVPNVVGLDRASATAALESAGFRVSVGQQSTTDQSQDGIVLAQYPSAGTQLGAGEKVRIIIGKFSPSP